MDAQKPDKVRIYDAASKTYQMVDKIIKTDGEWKKILTPEQYRVTREHGTERAFCGLPTKGHKKGVYKCAACGAELFSSETKYDSKSGWPSFYQPVQPGSVATQDDDSHFMHRTEAFCPICGGHLGHVFDDGPKPTGKRYCINSVSLNFEEKK